MVTVLPFCAATVSAFWIAFVLSVWPVGSALYGACVIEITLEAGVVGDEAAGADAAGVDDAAGDEDVEFGLRYLFAVAVGSAPSEPPPHAVRRVDETSRVANVVTGRLDFNFIINFKLRKAARRRYG